MASSTRGVAAVVRVGGDGVEVVAVGDERSGSASWATARPGRRRRRLRRMTRRSCRGRAVVAVRACRRGGRGSMVASATWACAAAGVFDRLAQASSSMAAIAALTWASLGDR